jgi:glyoxylase-like metal-dependent hydrolase (beta-lactamase superfamily II)
MAAPSPELKFNTEFDPKEGQAIEVAEGIARVTAPNRSPYTFTGTNSFVLGHAQVLVVDPGPDDPSHFDALMRAIGARQVEAILLTHTHKDHCALVPRLREATDAPLWFGGVHRLSRPARRFENNAIERETDWTLTPDRVLRDGERFAAAGLTIDVYGTPGHCANHLCFGMVGTPYLLSGDHVMGWNSTLVPVPDGSMRDYLTSLEKIIAAPYSRYLPAHGGPIADGKSYARALVGHRQLRNSQIIGAVTAGARTIAALRRRIYPKLSPGLMYAAGMTLQAHVEYLADRGDLRVTRGLFGTRVEPAR